MIPSSEVGPVRVLMITQDLNIDRRIVQEARSLAAAGYEVSIISRAAGTENGRETVEGIPVERVAVRGRDPRFSWLYRVGGVSRGSYVAAVFGVLIGRTTFLRLALPQAISARADVYHAHDLRNLELAYRAAQAAGGRLVYDAHELFPEVAALPIRIRRRAWARLERRLAPHADLLITVNELIARELSRRHGIAAPLVILNCADRPSGFDPRPGRYDLIRERLGLPATTRIVLYEGGFSEFRGLENLVRSARLLTGDAVLVLLGEGSLEPKLRRLAERESRGRVHFVEPVPQNELLSYAASADVGVIPYQPVDLNTYYSSPNKLFDYIQAALPMVVNDLPYLRQLVTRHGLGVVAALRKPSDYAAAINSILESRVDLARFRANLREVAPRYTWESQVPKFLAAYARVAPLM
ncbi:MAG: glycosyltransferase family 4 protein [Gaiellaceae bacterium]